MIIGSYLGRMHMRRAFLVTNVSGPSVVVEVPAEVAIECRV